MGSQRRRFSKFRLKNTADNFPATTDFDTSGEVGLDTDLARGSDTIQDASGIDTLDFSGTTTQVVSVNLSDAAAQVVNPALTLTLSAGNTIENVIGGALSDTLTGNSGDDVLSGRAGNDILIGGDGADQLTGGISEDLLLGGRYIYENDFIALDSLIKPIRSTTTLKSAKSFVCTMRNSPSDLKLSALQRLSFPMQRPVPNYCGKSPAKRFF